MERWKAVVGYEGRMSNIHEITHAHSIVGPSSSDRWLRCNGSVLLTKDMPNPDSEYSAHGTAAHELSEWCRVQGKPAEHWRGQILKVSEFEFPVDQEMIDAVNEFVEYVDQWPGYPLYEARVEYEDYVPGGFGTLDDARLLDNLCRVTDLKFGTGIQVFADDNPQLKLYALGLYLGWRHLFDFHDFILTVHQPRLDHVDQFEITLPELLQWADDVVRPTARIALEPGAPFKAGDHCTFCPARRTCRVRAEYVTQEAIGGFKNLDDDPAEVTLMSNEEVAQALPKLANLKKWCNDLEAYAIGEIAKGNKITHPETGEYKLVEGRSNRIWKKTPEDTAASLEIEVEDPEIIWEKKLISPAKAEKIIGKGKLDDLIVKPQGRPKLAPGTDKREAMTIDASAEFESLEEDDG